MEISKTTSKIAIPLPPLNFIFFIFFDSVVWFYYVLCMIVLLPRSQIHLINRICHEDSLDIKNSL